MFARLWAMLTGKRQGFNEAHKSVLTATGFEYVDVASGEVLARVEWQHVCEITAFKRDLFTIDQMCLLFKLVDNSYVEINEHESGWKEVRAQVEKRFPTIPADWWSHVAFPAFEPNATLLYPRDLNIPLEPGPTRPRNYRDAVSLIENAAVLFATVAGVCLLLKTHFVFGLGAVTLGLVTYWGAKAIRVHYQVERTSRILRDISRKAHPINDSGLHIESVNNRGFWIVVPAWITVPYSVLVAVDFAVLIVCITLL